MKTTNLPLEKLIAYAGNPRRNDHAVEAVAAAIKRFGFRVPVLAKSDGTLIDGHLRIKAAKRLGMTEVPVALCDDLSEAEIKALRISINRMAELAEWDEELLMAELEGLAAEGITMDDVGFDLDALEALGASAEPEGSPEADAEPQIDKAEELRAKWGVEPGQLWELGEHRLLCGDSTKKEDVDLLMLGEVSEMCFTDPPYGVEYVGKTKDALTIQNDGADGLPKLLDGAFASMQRATRLGGAWYVAAPAGPLHWEFAKRLMDLGVYRQTLVWVKDSMVLGHSDYHYKHEPIFYGWNPGAPHREMPDRTQVSVWEIPRPKRSSEHPTMKPVELVAKAVKNSSSVGSLVFEPFSGSGTTIIACEQLGRKARAIEISPAYVAVALQRWADATGKTPKLVA
jgi:DNA modification methylase